MNGLRLRGDSWEVTYDGRTATVGDCRGLRYIAILIRDTRPPAGPVHARELTALASGQDPGAIELATRDYVLDAKARKQMMDRLEEIAGARDRALAVGDVERAATLDEEYERIADELSRAAGRGAGSGRRATFSHEGEKARKAVGKAISEAIARVAACPGMAPLAEHLAAAVRKGQWLSYGGSSDWDVEMSVTPPRG